MGWRQWTRERLTAALMQRIQDQLVMDFASASARTSELAAPTEGMVSYLKDVQRMELYDGTAWRSVKEAPLDPIVNATWLAGAEQSSITVDGSGRAEILRQTVTTAELWTGCRLSVLAACRLGAQTAPGSGRFDLAIDIDQTPYGGARTTLEVVDPHNPTDAPYPQRLLTGVSGTVYTSQLDVVVYGSRPSSTSLGRVLSGSRRFGVYRWPS
jgi:hypothetical protein